MSVNIEKQKEELEVLTSVYGDQWKCEDLSNHNFSIEILEGKIQVILYITLTIDYPSEAPPVYQISAPRLSTQDKREISNRLEEQYLKNIGDSVIYQWIECVRSFLQQKYELANEDSKKQVSLLKNKKSGNLKSPITIHVPNIIHGDTICDRKSTFQGHVACVKNSEDVQTVLCHLKQNKKIANAKHNIYAYRIINEGSAKKIVIQDCDDDGENQAGSRLLHLLEISDAYNILVVVSRWYGGIHLGPDRFRHINNAARTTLSKLGFISKTK